MTLTELKTQLLTAISECVTKNELDDIETLTMTYVSLCQSETLCKCPMREDENQEFPTDIH